MLECEAADMGVVLYVYCRRGEDPVIAAIEQRIAEWTRLPPENGEPIQVGDWGWEDVFWPQPMVRRGVIPAAALLQAMIKS
jgi:hypothetical protein